MNFRSSLACTSSDIARWGLRSVLKRQGGVLPGRIAMKIDPELLSDLAGLVDRSVVITGTNGKTTTSNLIADAVAASGATVVCNRAGNNMEPGVVGALLEARGGLKHTSSGKRVGVFECDELYTVRVLPKLKPTYFVLLNLFRDQLDRYGEIDHTQDVIAHALELSPATTLIYNADDPLCAAIAARVPNASIAFGIDGATNTESDRISDSRFCSQCNAPLEYDYVQYGQLGAYHCPSCGWARPGLVRRVTNVELGCDGYGFDLVFGSASDAAAVHIATRYNGLYMVYNVAAAFFAAHELGVDTAHLHVVRARASGKGDKTRRVGDALKVDVVDPRYIVAVGVVVVEEESAESAACRLDGLDLSIEAYGILSQVGLDGAAGDIPAAHASAGGDVGIERGL